MNFYLTFGSIVQEAGTACEGVTGQLGRILASIQFWMEVASQLHPWGSSYVYNILMASSMAVGSLVTPSPRPILDLSTLPGPK